MKRALFWLLDVLGVNALCRWRHRGQLKVLLYHSISEPGQPFGNAVSLHDFSQHIEHLKRCYNVVRMDERGRVQGCVPDRVNVLLTFDDGFVDNHDVVSPLLARHGMSAVFFLIASCVPDGRVPRFLQDRISAQAEPHPAYRTVNLAQAQAMRRAGMVVGSHGAVHMDYAQADLSVSEADAAEAKALLERMLGVPVAAFAFPWGRHQSAHLVSLQKLHAAIFLTTHGFSRPDDRVFCRNEVADLAHLKCAASGALDLIKGAQR